MTFVAAIFHTIRSTNLKDYSYATYLSFTGSPIFFKNSKLIGLYRWVTFHIFKRLGIFSILVGGFCYGGEAVYEYRNKLSSTCILPGFNESRPQMKITGTIFLNDGTTPAKNVILYIYHTNRKGLYEAKNDEKGWGKKHGSVRGWIKTGDNGKYTFYTFRPKAYPTGEEAEHIHAIIREPGKREYAIDNFFFDDDPLLTCAERNILENRGGSGIVKPICKNGLLLIKRDIILGLNVPNYNKELRDKNI